MQHRTDAIRPRPRQGWLAAILPADARRFRVRDPELAAALASGGAELVDSAPDVEIAPADELVGDARLAIVPIEAQAPRAGRPRLVRAARRLADAAVVGGRTAAARRMALRRGYGDAIAVTWEPHTTLLPGLVRAPAGVPLFQRFPRHVVVVGRRGKPGPTAFEAARAAAERELGRTLDVRSIVLGSSGVVVAPADDVVLRVSVGPAASRVEEQRAALESLRAARPSAFVAERVPWVLASGSVGLAVWSLERRLRGAPATEVEQGVLGDCLDFLCELFAAHVDGARPASPRLDAEVCALHLPEHAETLYELGRRLEGALESVPRGFGHGDFWAGNLLVEDGRLAGVVDWPSAGPGRLPLLDLMHLRVNEVRERTRAPLAAVVAEHLLPLAGSGGHDLDREYCRRLGLDLAGSDLEGLVGAYWLEALRHDLVDPDRDPAAPARPEWRNANLEVLSVLARRFGIRTGSQ